MNASLVKTILLGPISDINNDSKDRSSLFSSYKCLIKFIKRIGLTQAVNIVKMTKLKHFFNILDWSYNATSGSDFVFDQIFCVDFQLSKVWRES